MDMPQITQPRSDFAVLEEELSRAAPLPSVRRAMLSAALTLLVGVGGLTAWAVLTPLQSAVIAGGQLVAESKRKQITLLEPGILRELAVREGAVVKAGDVLMRLDVTQAEATADQARAAVWGGRARLARLDAERRDQRQLEMPAEVQAAATTNRDIAALMESEQQLFRARWAAADGAVELQRRQIDQLKAQLDSYPVQRRSLEAQLVALRRRISGYGDLAKLGFSSLFLVYQLQEQEATYLSQQASTVAQELATRQQLAAAEVQLANLVLQRQQDIATDTQTTQAAVAAAEQTLRSAEDVLRRREVVAPEDGTITNIQQYSPGSSIQSGQLVMELVPANTRLIAEVQVDPVDIEQVLVGQRANIRLTAYRSHQLPLIEGRVIYVAADAVPNPATNAFYYVARLEIDQQKVAANGLALSPGMPTETFILGPTRSVAAYLTTPISNSLRRAFRDY